MKTLDEKEKIQLYIDMHQHAKEVNKGWKPNWMNEDQAKYLMHALKGKDITITPNHMYNHGVFGIAYKTKELAEQAKEKFKERICKYYN